MHGLLRRSAIRNASRLATAVVAGMLAVLQICAAQPSSEILQELHRLGEMGRVLHVAAHPDDENTQLIAYLVHERGYDAAYLSMTRGEGGQNLIGGELGDALGVIRTNELLAARSVDGGKQFFSRAADFGYSKDYRETLEKWGHEAVLSDVVRVIRTFRPHVIITRFPPEPVDGLHGHHTASAVLAVEAFHQAGDPTAFPEQLDELEPWQPTRVLWNRWGDADPDVAVLTVDVGGYSALRGLSYGEIAARSRSMHKSQGFGAVATRGERIDRFVHLAGQPATRDPFDDIEASWSDIPDGDAVRSVLDDIIRSFDPADPSASVPLLLAMRQRMERLPDEPVVAEKLRHLDQILVAALGLHVETRISAAEVVVGAPLQMTHRAIARTAFPIRWLAVRYPDGEEAVAQALAPNRETSRQATRRISVDAPLTHPHWLESGQNDSDNVGAIAPLGRAPYPIQHVFEVAGARLVVEVEPEEVIRDPVRGEVRHRMEIVPPVALSFADEIALIEEGGTADVQVRVQAARDDVQGIVRLTLPTGWSASPRQQEIDLAEAGDEVVLTFMLQAPDGTDRAEILAEAVVEDRVFGSTMVEIDYEHIPRQLLFPPARLVAMSADVATAGESVGYIAGAGDQVGDGLARMGYRVTEIGTSDLTTESLGRFDAVVLGIRALNTRADLARRMDELFGYVHNGGTLVIQYNTSQGLVVDPIAPHPIRLGRDRITDERATLTPLVPDHPVLNHPNAISAEDFEGWVQERGLYFAVEWDDAFTPVLAGRDPGEDPVEGALLVASYGDGHIVYTGLSFFRQLPAGVPGAYRLLANIISLGR